MAEVGERRFVVKSEEEVKKLLDDGVPAHTRRATETRLAAFTAFYAEQNIQIDLITCSGQLLNQVLCKFRPSLRTKKGGLYKKASYLAAQAAIQRRVHEFNRPFNIFKSKCFAQSHHVLDNTSRSKKTEGLEPAVQHKEPLSAEDFQRLQVSLYVSYVIILQFGLEHARCRFSQKRRTSDRVRERQRVCHSIN